MLELRLKTKEAAEALRSYSFCRFSKRLSLCFSFSFCSFKCWTCLFNDFSWRLVYDCNNAELPVSRLSRSSVDCTSRRLSASSCWRRAKCCMVGIPTQGVSAAHFRRIWAAASVGVMSLKKENDRCNSRNWVSRYSCKGTISRAQVSPRCPPSPSPQETGPSARRQLAFYALPSVAWVEIIGQK